MLWSDFLTDLVEGIHPHGVHALAYSKCTSTKLIWAVTGAPVRPRHDDRVREIQFLHKGFRQKFCVGGIEILFAIQKDSFREELDLNSEAILLGLHLLLDPGSNGLRVMHEGSRDRDECTAFLIVVSHNVIVDVVGSEMHESSPRLYLQGNLFPCKYSVRTAGCYDVMDEDEARAALDQAGQVAERVLAVTTAFVRKVSKAVNCSPEGSIDLGVNLRARTRHLEKVSSSRAARDTSLAATPHLIDGFSGMDA